MAYSKVALNMAVDKAQTLCNSVLSCSKDWL